MRGLLNKILYDRWNDLRFVWVAVVGVAMVLGVLGVLGLLIDIPVVALEGAACERKADAREVEGWLGGWQDTTCYVRTEDGRVLTIDQYDVQRHEVVIG